MALTKVRGSGLDGATALKGQELVIDADGDTSITADTDDIIHFKGGGSDRDTIDTNGHLLVAKSSTGIGTVGAELKSSGELLATVSGDACAFLNRTSDDGNILICRKDNVPVLELGSVGGLNGYIEGDGNRAGFEFGTGAITPRNNSASADDTIDLGHSSVRFDDVFATNGTIQTSDQNEKQDIASATTKELNVAKKLSALFKTFRWKSKVAEKGDKARTHTGIIAQEIQSVFSAEGLDASDYGLFISDTWTNDDGKEQTRLGVRYPELFSFIFSSIEARLTALESK